MLKILSAIFLIFLLLFVFRANLQMFQSAFNEFDEAHRAENVKRMVEYKSFFIPLTGSPQDRWGQIRVPFKENRLLFIYYHLERPVLIYDLMVISSSIFGSIEWAYRLPSFIFGMCTIGTLVFFFFKIFREKNIPAIFISLIALITSRDLWLSSQYAQLDTGLMFFLFLAFLSLIRFTHVKSKVWLRISALSFGLAILSKGQPAVIFFLPLAYLWAIKKLRTPEVLELILWAFAIISPWVLYISVKFGFWNLINIFLGFATTTATVPFINNQAPIYWYLRWWVFSFRVGLVLFVALLIRDLLQGKLGWEKRLSLFYIAGSFIFFSLSINKLWWYVMPLIPVTAYYIYLSCIDYLGQVGKKGVTNLSLIMILTSLPVLFEARSIIALLYLVILTIVATIILRLKINLSKAWKNIFFCVSVTLSLLFFYFRFPQIIPYDKGIKPVASYYTTVPKPKCLYILDLPPESALFYSNAGEVSLLTEGTILLPECQNYLITSRNIVDQKVIYENNGLKLYKLVGTQIK